MRRPTSLVVDTTLDDTTSSTTSSPDASTTKFPVSADSSAHKVGNVPRSPQYSPPSPPEPSIRLLFSLISRRHFFILLLPALLSSIFAGGIAPFMTLVVGQVFDALSKFPVDPNPPEAAKKQLLHDVGMTAIELVALAIGALALSSLTSCLWIWTGERNLRAVRKEVYTAVTRKDMIWFDTKMGEENSVQTAEGDGPVGAGGLMAKFARDTDDVRMASSLASGMLVQYLTTTITCLILAFIRSWSLTLVILSALPAMVLIQSLSQAFVGPNLNNERTHTATAATLVDHAVSAISTVKAFNAELHEAETIGVVLDKLQSAANKCIAIWGITGTFAQFVMMAMFVQGFWFGSKLVREGKNSVGDVTTVFWACLIASSNLQMCIPQFIIFAKGKFAMAALVALMESTAAPPDDHHGPTVHTPLYKRSRRTTELRKIIPSSCSGGLELIDVTFAYPSRPTMPVLSNVSVFLPAGETTFIVGGSGSGKSTIAQLLLRMYNLQEGMIRLDEQDVAYLDSKWTRQHISAVSQNCILFDMTVHDNVAMGLAGPGSSRRPEDVTREEVVAVCRAALMHEFVRDLPDGYDTKLGNGGANLSGGQKQRLAIARALLRNPTVLILDEATSALDATSRLLVFEAIKAWRRNMTTVVITHDLSQITSEDFVYVLRSGALVEQGFREDLEQCSDGEFFHMAHMQDISGGFLPEESPRDFKSAPLDAILEQQEVEKDKELEAAGFNRLTIKHQSIYRPLTMGNWMLDAVADLTKPTAAADIPALSVPHQAHPTNRYFPDEVISPKTPKENRFSLHVDIPITPAPVAISGATNRRYSLPFTPASPTSKFSFPESTLVDEDETMEEKYGYERVARRVTQRRMTDASIKKHIRAKWDEKTLSALRSVKVEPSEPEEKKDVVPIEPQVSFWRLMKDIYPTVPHKPLIVFGLFMSLASGAMTPIFSYLFSRLLYEVSIGAQNVRLINTYGGIVLTVAALDGIVYGLKYVVMEYAAMKWVTKIRKTCLQLVFSQDKKWFDKTENSSVRLMQIIIKDGDDARTLIATVLSQLFVVAAMLGIGLIWALIIGWQLTLMGIAIAPVFAIAMTVQTNLVSKCEVRNKRAREDVAKGYYDAISNVRGIRAMGFETAFQDKFDKSVDEALTTGVRGAFVEGCTYGVASALIYLAEALIFYVGAVLIAHGTYDYLRMIQVLNLVVFTVSIGSQLMAFTQRIAKSVQATRDFNTLLKLTTDTDESRGTLRPPVVGNVSFNHINFSYPERPDVPVLKDFSVEVGDSECVAIVGSSGSGKSTMASLLQRLYEPASGSITIGYNDIALADAHHLRNHISVVSQQPNLFDCTIAENIAYGNKSLSEADIRAAARAAHVHDFIMTLPKGYETHVGENASLISGGQAQRLQIARALARPAKILILDECTSALDPQNQAAVMEAIMDVKAGRTTIMVTHKLPVMRMCDRILVVHEGAIVEEGTYEDLMQRRGVFAQLASGGEWMD